MQNLIFQGWFFLFIALPELHFFVLFVNKSNLLQEWAYNLKAFNVTDSCRGSKIIFGFAVAVGDFIALSSHFLGWISFNQVFRAFKWVEFFRSLKPVFFANKFVYPPNADCLCFQSKFEVLWFNLWESLIRCALFVPVAGFYALMTGFLA